MSAVEKKRPVAILVLCALFLIGTVLALAALPFNPDVRAQGLWYRVYSGLALIVGLAALYGYFQMKRVGVVVYALLTVANQYVLWRQHWWNASTLIMPAIMLSIGLLYWKEMD